MAGDKTVRCLSALRGASSSRVLNLLAIGNSQAEAGATNVTPFFDSPILNSAIILKHRLRADETDLFQTRRALATKIIIPFERSDLRCGGQSLFVGQKSYEELLRQVGNYGEKISITRDLEVLRLIDLVPSLDPFLLREHLRSNSITPDGSYFEISIADRQRMHDYAATEVSRLTNMASGRSGGHDAATSKMVSALLSTEVNEKLEPLRATLNLNPEEFCEGVFSWRGFIYYKWSLGEFWPNLIKALHELKAIRPVGRADPEQTAYMTVTKQSIIRSVKDNSDEVRRVLGIYDNAYASLIEKQDPKMFREFLLSAPSLFLEMGEKMGAMSHITSFWQYRFPPGAPRTVDADELAAIFQDFSKSFGLETHLAA